VRRWGVVVIFDVCGVAPGIFCIHWETGLGAFRLDLELQRAELLRGILGSLGGSVIDPMRMLGGCTQTTTTVDR
jgi:hypothetical protein